MSKNREKTAKNIKKIQKCFKREKEVKNVEKKVKISKNEKKTTKNT